MKTSDLHIAERGSNGSGSSLRTLLGLDWLSGGKTKQKKKFKAGTYRIPCALIIGERSASTDRKTSLTEALREHAVSV